MNSLLKNEHHQLYKTTDDPNEPDGGLFVSLYVFYNEVDAKGNLISWE